MAPSSKPPHNALEVKASSPSTTTQTASLSEHTQSHTKTRDEFQRVTALSVVARCAGHQISPPPGLAPQHREGLRTFRSMSIGATKNALRSARGSDTAHSDAFYWNHFDHLNAAPKRGIERLATQEERGEYEGGFALYSLLVSF